MMDHDELLKRSIDAAFFGDFDQAFDRPRRDLALEDLDRSDTDEAEVEFERADLVDVDVIVPQGDEGDAA